MTNLKDLLIDKRIVKRRRCKHCNWTPPGEPKRPDTWFCMNEKVLDVTPNCSFYVEPCEDEGDC